MTSDELFSKSNTQYNKVNNDNNNYNRNNYKNTYETQYTKNEFEKKKTNRRHTAKSIDFLSSHNNITGNENRIVEDITYKNNKKLFETVYYKKSLTNLYKGDLEKMENPQPEKKEIIHALKTKKHFVIIFFSYFLFNFLGSRK